MMRIFIILFLFSQVLSAKSVRLQDLAVKRPHIGLSVLPKATPRLMDQFTVKKEGLSVTPQTEFFEKLYAEDFNLEQTLKDLDIGHPPIEGKFLYQF